MISVGVIGYGYWGPNLVRNFMTNSDSRVLSVCDRDSMRLEKAQSLYPAVKVSIRSEDLILDAEVDAVVIATPVASHYELAMAALKAGKHVFVEKPITIESAQASKLIDEAASRKLVLMVDHTFVYTGAVRKIRELTKTPAFGKLRYYDSTRVNLGIFQHDVNVLWDLAVHDLTIMSYLIDDKPVAVSATGCSHIQGQPENMAFLTVFFSGDLIAHINVNWLSPVKIRQTLIGGDQQMIVYDDLEQSAKLKIYDTGITVTETPDDIHNLMVSYRTGDLWSPKLADAEALQVEVEHFVACIKGEQQPLTGGEQGLEIVRILEAANISMSNRGVPVDL
jgi:predicted dehydrogenase